MQKKLRITVEGKVYDVTVEELTENGHAAPVMPSIAGTGAPTAVTAAPLAAAPVTPAPAAPAAGAGDEISPLAGVVDSVEVSVGAKINAGDKIAVIEAMKMKTPVYAGRSGTITAVAIKPGDAVSPGQPLLTIA